MRIVVSASIFATTTPPPPDHLGARKHVPILKSCIIYTTLQHCDTLSAVFAHVASRLATTDCHRSTQTTRATVKTSKKVPPRGEQHQQRIPPVLLAHQGACCSKISPGGGLWRAQSGGEFAVHNSRQRSTATLYYADGRLQRVKKNITEMLYEVLRTSLRVPDGSYGPY